MTKQTVYYYSQMTLGKRREFLEEMTNWVNPFEISKYSVFQNNMVYLRFFFICYC